MFDPHPTVRGQASKMECYSGGNAIAECAKGESFRNLVGLGDVNVNGSDVEGDPQAVKFEEVESQFDEIVKQIINVRTMEIGRGQEEQLEGWRDCEAGSEQGNVTAVDGW